LAGDEEDARPGRVRASSVGVTRSVAGPPRARATKLPAPPTRGSAPPKTPRSAV